MCFSQLFCGYKKLANCSTYAASERFERQVNVLAFLDFITLCYFSLIFLGQTNNKAAAKWLKLKNGYAKNTLNWGARQRERECEGERSVALQTN